MTLPVTYGVLFASVVCEVLGTAAFLSSNNFTRLLPTILMAVFYSASVVGLSLAFRVIPMGVVYALLSGFGIVLTALVGWVGYGQAIDAPAVIGIGMIVAGVIVVQAFSNSLLL